VLVAAAFLSACGTSGTGTGVDAIQPRDGRSGLQLSGTIGGRQVAVNDGAPVLRLGDCDVDDGADTDLCVFSREVDGGYFALIVENPDAVTVGRVDIVDSDCRSPNCEAVGDGAVVDVQREPGGPRTRATGGNLTFETVERAQRYAGTINLELPDGRLSGTFQIVPRPEPEE
jgi:hypothetical protein